MKIYLTSLGCRLNQAEIEALGRRAARWGCDIVGDPALADWAIVNTCTVTQTADRKSRSLVRRLKREYPHLRLAIIGCYAEMAPDQVRDLGVDLILPNPQKEQVLARILGKTSFEQVAESVERLPCERTRAFVKVQEGCDNRCAYCVVTLARGPSQSTPPDEVLSEIRDRLARGAQEIVLTGINLGAYGLDRGPQARVPQAAGWSLARLIQYILEETEVPRLRLSSIEPWQVTPDLLRLWPNPRLCRQLHLPLQSGCDETLRRMGRHYSTSQFAQLVARIRDRIPDMLISTDVIVGFPGETDREFACTLDFVENVAPQRLHVFRFSPRPKTRAASLPNQVDPRIAHRRSETLRELSKALASSFAERFVGRYLEVLFETCSMKDGQSYWSGLSDNYLRVMVPSSTPLGNRILKVHCRAREGDRLLGILATNE